MNAHQLWLRQLQEKQEKRIEEGNLTEAEKNRLQNTIPSSETSKSLHEAIAEVAEISGQILPKSQPQQLDEIPFLAPLAGMAVRAVAGKVAKKAIKGVSAMVAGGQKEESVMAKLELDRLMEQVSYKLIEELEESLGRRLEPEEIEEFVENNYDKIIAEASNQVTAHAVPGDLHKGVGATKPQVPTNKVKMLKAKAAKFNPKRTGTDGY